MTERTADVLVVGSGIAGLTFGLKLAGHVRVVLATKKERADSSTNYARGGIASVLGEDDDVRLHVGDTLVTGAGLCHRAAVEALVREGPARVVELMEWGARFDRDGAGRLSLGREGGHSRRRIAHAGDHTGREIESALLAAVEAADSIAVLEDHLAVDLLVGRDARGRPRCGGAVLLDHDAGRIVRVLAPVTMLATGGCGQVYRHTTNPAIATGDGIAMAYRAGAEVANMEFVQFHPTAFHPTEDPAFLLSEAMRGEGAVLRALDGTPFMEAHHPLGSLAPRDVVARAIDGVLKARGETHVLLDAAAIPAGALEARFPEAVAGCRARGVDPTSEAVPVVPAAHYVCGGVRTDSRGRTSLPGLYAAGEVACSGVHGANRLASNSLLEAVVLADRAARDVASLDETGRVSDLRPAGSGPAEPRGTRVDAATLEALRAGLRSTMWESAGIVRSDRRLAAARAEIARRARRSDELWREGDWSPEGAELRNLLEVARLIVHSALRRRESRGLHHNTDHPWRDNERFLRDTVLAARDGELR